MSSRRPRLIATFAALTAMLFMQATLALAACEPAPGHPGMAYTQEAMPDCHQGDDAPNLCAPHCQVQDQALGKLQPQLPDLAQPPAIAVAWQAPRALQSLPAAFVPLAAPPPRILFQPLRL